MSTTRNVAGASSSRTPNEKLAKLQAAASSSRTNAREQDAPATSFDSAPLWEYFNPGSEIDIRTGGHLPHWEQGSVWYFVTFRLADSLPRAVVKEIQQQREQWRRTHNLQNLSADERAEYHQLFSARYEQLLHAGLGSCVLRDSHNASIVRDVLRFFHGGATSSMSMWSCPITSMCS